MRRESNALPLRALPIEDWENDAVGTRLKTAFPGMK